MKTKNKTIKFLSHFLIILIIISTILVYRPQKANAYMGIGDVGTSFDPPTEVAAQAAVGTNAAGAASGAANAATSASGLGIATNTWYGKLLDQVLMAVARKVLGEITKSTINWIDSGFHGAPLFLENPGSFFNDIAKSQIKMYVDMFGYDKIKFPFGQDFALSMISSYKNTLQNNASYTMSNVIKDETTLNNYRNDFAFGGWNGFLVNTQYPQNNYLGFRMTVAEGLARSVQGTAKTAVKEVTDTLQQGQGFLSPKTCPSNPAYNNGTNEFQKPSFDEAGYNKIYPYNPPPVKMVDGPNGFPIVDEGSQVIFDNYDKEWKKNHDEAVAGWSSPTGPNVCPGGLKSTTPGAVVASQITTALGSNFRQTELGAAMGNSLSAIFDALLNKFIGSGLTALATSINPETKPTDTWSYMGQTLGSDGNDWSNMPDVVVDLRQFRISIEGKTVRTFVKGDILLNEDGTEKVYNGGEALICENNRPQIKDEAGKDIDCVNGDPILYVAGDPILDENGNQKKYDGTEAVFDNEGNIVTNADGTVKRHTAGELVFAKGGEQKIHTNGEKIYARGGEILTEIGDTTDIEPKSEKEYFPGDIENTIEELATMDNPCDPSSEDYNECFYNANTNRTKPTGAWTNNTNYKINAAYIQKYNPGIVQVIGPLIDATQALDWCTPGPDKNWGKRLDSEYDTQRRKLDQEVALQDEWTSRAAKSMLGDLKFAVMGFKDWIDNRISTALPASMFYTDTINELDDISQQLTDVTNAKKTKVRALNRLSVIKQLLKDLATTLKNNTKFDENGNVVPDPLTQPKPGSGHEKILINYKKQYDAVSSSISSVRSVEDSKKQLQVLKDKLDKIINPSPTKGYLAQCTQQRNNSQWKNVTLKGEQRIFCDIPIVSGYSHGETIRHSDAGQCSNWNWGSHCNNGGWPRTSKVGTIASKIGTADNDANVPMESWFVFRNQLGFDNGILEPPFCSGTGGGSVQSNPVKVTITSNRKRVRSGAANSGLMISWSSTNATTCTVTNDDGDLVEDGNALNKPAPGISIGALNRETTYTISCSDSKTPNPNTAEASVTIAITSGAINPDDGGTTSDGGGNNNAMYDPNGMCNYSDLPMVNARDIEGDGTVNNWITIGIGCDTIMNAKKTDYTHAGDILNQF